MTSHAAAINVLRNAKAENETFRVAALRADPKSSEVFYQQNDAALSAAIDALVEAEAVANACDWDGSKPILSGEIVIHKGKLWRALMVIHNRDFEPGKMLGAFEEYLPAPLARLAAIRKQGYADFFGGDGAQEPDISAREDRAAWDEGMARAKAVSDKERGDGWGPSES